MHRMRRRPSAALVVSLVALFVALGGTGYAAIKLPKNSVASPQVVNGSLGTADLSKKARAALKGNRGARGPAGAAGIAGAAGAAGPAGTAVAYADFNGAGAIQSQTTPFNITVANMHHVGTGIYCFKNLGFTPHSAVVAADNSFGVNDTIATVFTGTVLTDCDPGELVRVRTTDHLGALADRAFVIWFL